MKFYLLKTLFCLFLGASMTSAQNVDLKKSAKLLSSKSAQTQLKAEKQLKASGYDALKHIVPLMYDKNEKVEKRARRIYAWIMFGLNDTIPHENCEKIYRFGTLNADEKLALIEQCSKLKTKHPFMLAALHSRVLETLPQNKKDREKLKKKASSALTINLTNKNFKPEEFDPRLLMVETRAIVMSDVWRLGCDAKIQQVYEAWFKIDSKIRNYLTSTGVLFELKRLEKVENPHKELVFYNALVSSYAKKMVKSKMSPKWHSKIPFKLTDLNEAEAIAYLDIVVSDGNEMKRLKDFKLLQKKFPTLVQKMPTHLKVLEVHFLLELKQFYPAFELAMKIQMESKTALKCWRDLGVWANKNPDSLTNGLPHAPVKLARQMKLFIEGLTSVTQNQPVKITEEKMKLFSDLINRSEAKIAEEWMMLLRDYHVYHYIWLSAIRGKLDSVITHFESVRNRTAIYTLGRVISKNTALSEQIVAKNHHVKTMEILVTTIWNGIRDGYPSFQKCDKIIVEWEKAHPELLKQSKLSGAILFLASRLWQQGKRELAVEKLIGKRGNDYRASWLLIHLLEKTPAAEVKELLSGVEVPASFMKVMIKHYLEDKKVTIDKARQLITVWSLNLNKGRNLSYSLSYLARTYAYQLWRLGQTDLAYLVLQNAFWDDADKQELYIGLFPELALTVGKINEAIAYGDTLKVKQAKNRHSLKMAYLYRAAGDLKQANAHVKEFPNTKLRTKLAILSKDWNAALQSLSVKTNRSNKDYQISLNAWYAYMQGDEKKALAEYALLKKPNKWMMLTVATAEKNYPKALYCYQMYAENIMHTTFASYRKFYEVTPKLLYLNALEMICAAQEGDHKKVMFYLEQRMKVAPYDNLLLAETLKILKDKGDAETIQAIDGYITKYWQAKRLLLPHYEPYTQALKAWQEIIK